HCCVRSKPESYTSYTTLRKHKRTRGLRCPSPLRTRIADMSTGRAGHVARSTHRPHAETADGSPAGAPVRTFLRTADGVSIDARYEPGAGAGDAGDLVFVVAHGFTGDADRPHVR